MTGYRTTTIQISNRARVMGPLAAGIGLITRSEVRPGSVQAENADGPLPEMLALIPPEVLGNDPRTMEIIYADIAGQFSAAEVERPNAEGESRGDWVGAISPLAIADPFNSRLTLLEREFIGFDGTDLDQTLQTGAPPLQITLLRGRFDHSEVKSALTAQGYATIEIDGIEAFSLHEELEIDLESELFFALGKWNNAAFLPDGTLALAPTLHLLESIIATATGTAASIVDDEAFRKLLEDPFTPVASCMIVPGLRLALASMVDPVVLLEPIAVANLNNGLAETGAMAAIAWALLGIEPGAVQPKSSAGKGNGNATMVVKLVMAQTGTADDAAEVVRARIETLDSIVLERPYSSFFASMETSVSDDDDTLLIELPMTEETSPHLWLNLLLGRDLLFLAW